MWPLGVSITYIIYLCELGEIVPTAERALPVVCILPHRGRRVQVLPLRLFVRKTGNPGLHELAHIEGFGGLLVGHVKYVFRGWRLPLLPVIQSASVSQVNVMSE